MGARCFSGISICERNGEEADLVREGISEALANPADSSEASTATIRVILGTDLYSFTGSIIEPRTVLRRA